MTLDNWLQNPEHYFEFTLSYSEIQSVPEWSDWEERIDKVLQDMDYEDAMGCTFDDLIDSAKIRGEIKGEIEKARKQHIENKRIEKAKEDFV